MPKESSPFFPGRPVPVEFFVGRRAEIDQVLAYVARAATGRIERLFLSGERGIGKSSLASFCRALAERERGMLGIHAFLGGVASLEEMVRRVFDRVLKESVGKGWHEKVKRFLGHHIREVGLLGVSVEFGAPEKDLRRLVDDFGRAIRNLMARLEDEKRGLLLVLDDINGLADSADFANWTKSLVDEISTSGEPLPLCLMFVGYEERRQSLLRLQPSLGRVFTPIEIPPWSGEETKEFFQDAFEKAGVSVEPEAFDHLERFTGGLPLLAHEIGDAVLALDQDNRIDAQDALDGIVVAADVVGRKYLQPQVFQAIRSTKYLAILRKLAADTLQMQFTRSAVRSALATEEKGALDNFLTKMKTLGVIRPDSDGGPGAYEFVNQLHRLYFLIEASRAQKTPTA